VKITVTRVTRAHNSISEKELSSDTEVTPVTGSENKSIYDNELFNQSDTSIACHPHNSLHDKDLCVFARSRPSRIFYYINQSQKALLTLSNNLSDFNLFG